MLARSASPVSPRVPRSSVFTSRSSFTDSTMRSHSARSSILVVTRIMRGVAPSTLAHSASARSSARQAETSLRAQRRTSPSALAHAAMPHAIAPLPAIPGRSYPSEPLTPAGYYHAQVAPEPPDHRKNPSVGVSSALP